MQPQAPFGVNIPYQPPDPQTGETMRLMAEALARLSGGQGAVNLLASVQLPVEARRVNAQPDGPSKILPFYPRGSSVPFSTPVEKPSPSPHVAPVSLSDNVPPVEQPANAVEVPSGTSKPIDLEPAPVEQGRQPDPGDTQAWDRDELRRLQNLAEDLLNRPAPVPTADAGKPGQQPDNDDETAGEKGDRSASVSSHSPKADFQIPRKADFKSPEGDFSNPPKPGQVDAKSSTWKSPGKSPGKPPETVFPVAPRSFRAPSPGDLKKAVQPVEKTGTSKSPEAPKPINPPADRQNPASKPADLDENKAGSNSPDGVKPASGENPAPKSPVNATRDETWNSPDAVDAFDDEFSGQELDDSVLADSNRLWNLEISKEKESGKIRLRRVLRFVEPPIREEIGTYSPKDDAALERRPGRGRWGKSRNDADALRMLARETAIALRRSKSRRRRKG